MILISETDMGIQWNGECGTERYLKHSRTEDLTIWEKQATEKTLTLMSSKGWQPDISPKSEEVKCKLI